VRVRHSGSTFYVKRILAALRSCARRSKTDDDSTLRAAQLTHLTPSFTIALTTITEESSYVGHCFRASRDNPVGRGV
jgi:hypothetical protein